MADRIRRTRAIVEHVIHSSIAADKLILFKRANQAIERFDGNRVPLDRSFQSNEDGMRSGSGIHRFELAAPPSEQTQALFAIADFVPKIIRPATICIDVVEILMQALW